MSISNASTQQQRGYLPRAPLDVFFKYSMVLKDAICAIDPEEADKLLGTHAEDLLSNVVVGGPSGFVPRFSEEDAKQFCWLLTLDGVTNSIASPGSKVFMPVPISGLITLIRQIVRTW